MIKENLNLNATIAKDLLEKYKYPWEALPNINKYILELLPKLGEEYNEIFPNVYAHKTANISKTACINGPAIIGKNTEIRHCAYIRGNAIIGDNCVIGNSTEVKNAIIFNNVQCPHYNYVGDAILGEYAHTGAGVILSNVKSDKTNIKVKIDDEIIDTNLKKFSAIIGDHVEVGCNSVLCPGTIIYKNTNIYPLTRVRGTIKENKIVKDMNNIIEKGEHMGKLFGTDGIRGIVGKDLTIELATKVGEATSHVLGKDKEIKVLIGSDTRISGTMLTMALSAGLMSGGAKVIDLGIVPTPAVSYLTKKYNANIGIMISASHNPSEYNGIKIFDSNGFKLSDELENEIEEYLFGKPIPQSNKIGSYEINNNAIKDYTDYLATTINKINKDLKIIIDCAYGSASVTAPTLFDKINLNPEFMNINYDGYNINNNAGSTHLEGLIEKVKETKADVGVAFDGDADRCLMVDELGNTVDGDQIIALCASILKKENKLTNNTVVGTVMSNLGLSKFCDENNLNYVATKVGDRYVLENMLENNYIIGGEQSGHIIFKELANTGDGQLTALQVLNILTKENKKLSELAQVMTKYPQVLVNVAVQNENKNKYKTDEEIINLINEIEQSLNTNGRILIRPSGTEALIRVMIEGLNQESITKDANRIAKLIKKKYGN